MEDFKIITDEQLEALKEMFSQESLKELIEKANDPKLDKAELGTFEVVITTGDVDRHGEVVNPDGADVKNFKKNPVVLLNHNYWGLPIGVATSLKKTDGKWIAKGIFAPTDDAQTVRHLYDAGIMKATSIGFIVKERKKDDQKVINKWELLEFSFVTVPANPDALTVDQMKIIEKMAEKLKVKQEDFENKNEYAEAVCCKAFGFKIEKLDDGKIEFIFEERTVVRHNISYEKAETDTWDGAAAKKRLAAFFSKDNTGEKEDMNWSQYKNGFAWFDGGNKESFGAYKLPHHTIIDGKFVVSKKGVQVAMGALLGARGGVDIPDNEFNGVFNHLAKHYKEFDLEVPEKQKNITNLTDEEMNLLTRGEIKNPDAINADIEKFEELSEEELKNIDISLKDIEIEDKRWDETENEFRFRIREPDLFDEFRRMTIKKDKPRVFGILGKLKGKDDWKMQALRFPKKDDWTLAEAKKWVKDHPDITKQKSEESFLQMVFDTLQKNKDDYEEKDYKKLLKNVLEKAKAIGYKIKGYEEPIEERITNLEKTVTDMSDSLKEVLTQLKALKTADNNAGINIEGENSVNIELDTVRVCKTVSTLMNEHLGLLKKKLKAQTE